MRAWALALLATTACRQVLGIPGEGTTGSDVERFAIHAAIQGADGATGGASVLLNDTPEPLVDGDDVTLATRLEDGASFTIVPQSGNCTVGNGIGSIDGADATGVSITCDGLAALDRYEFTAPVESLHAPGDGSGSTLGSILTQETYLVPVPKHPTASVTRVLAGGAELFPVNGRYGPIAFGAFEANQPLDVRLSGSGYTRDYTSALGVAPPSVFGYGKPDAIDAGASFGSAIASAGDQLVVGAPDAGDGRVFVFQRTGRTWTQRQELIVSGLQASARFGASVAIADTLIVVGAPGGAAGGTAYTFRRQGATWALEATLEPPSPAVRAAGDEFGGAVAIGPTQTIVGAPGCSAQVESMPSGCVVTFGAATEVLAPARPGDRFGASVAISGTSLVVGAPGDDSAIAGDPADSSYPNAGAAFLYDLSLAPSATNPRYLKAASPGADDRFGTAVAIEGPLIVIGAPLEDSAASGVDQDALNDDADAAGAAYLFHTSDLANPRYLKAPSADAGDNFGRALAIRGAVVADAQTCVVAIGAPYEDSSTAADLMNEAAPDSGAIFAYSVAVQPAPILTAPAYLKASNVGAGDAFGIAIALTTDTLVAGAPSEDGGTGGWNAPATEAALDAGAVYAFR